MAPRERFDTTVALRLGATEVEAVRALAAVSGRGASAIMRIAVQQFVDAPRVVITQQPAGTAGQPPDNAQLVWTTHASPASWTGGGL